MSLIVENEVQGAGTSEEASVVAVDEEATERDIERREQVHISASANCLRERSVTVFEHLDCSV